MFGRLESGMEEFDPCSDAWNRKWRSSSQVPTLGIGNGGVPSQVRCFDSGMEEFAQVPTIVIGVRAKFQSLESGMENFETQVPMFGIGIGGVLS